MTINIPNRSIVCCFIFFYMSTKLGLFEYVKISYRAIKHTKIAFFQLAPYNDTSI